MQAHKHNRLEYAQYKLPEIQKEFDVIVHQEFHWTVKKTGTNYLPIQFYPSTGKWVDYHNRPHKGTLRDMLNDAREETGDKYL